MKTTTSLLVGAVLALILALGMLAAYAVDPLTGDIFGLAALVLGGTAGVLLTIYAVAHGVALGLEMHAESTRVPPAPGARTPTYAGYGVGPPEERVHGHRTSPTEP